MWSILGASVDVSHALLMAAWALGIPILFVPRWPRLRRAYGIYAIVFIVVSQVSQTILGECFLTTLARACWARAVEGVPAADVSGEWFTVRLANAVFRLTPTHRAVTLVSEALIIATAIGVLVSARRRPAGLERSSDSPRTPAPR